MMMMMMMQTRTFFASTPPPLVDFSFSRGLISSFSAIASSW